MNAIITAAETEIRQALAKLGVKGCFKARKRTSRPDETQYSVYLNGFYYGIYDTAKHTFVD